MNPNAPASTARRAARDPAPDAGAAFKAAMRHLAGGVSIVTVADGADHGGLTATSMVSLSAEPPSLLVSVKQRTSCLRLMRRSGRFAVNILGDAHQMLADRFAGRDGLRGAARFADAHWIGEPGAPPILADALASFDCEVEEMIDRFSHTIVIGRVIRSWIGPGAGPALIYWRAGYDRIGATET